MDLQLKEIFLSLEGETTDAGFQALFIRLRCNLFCSWCDTRDSREGGVPVPLGDILDVVTEYSWVYHVTVTGGEPLAQNGGRSSLLTEYIRFMSSNSQSLLTVFRLLSENIFFNRRH